MTQEKRSRNHVTFLASEGTYYHSHHILGWHQDISVWRQGLLGAIMEIGYHTPKPFSVHSSKLPPSPLQESLHVVPQDYMCLRNPTCASPSGWITPAPHIHGACSFTSTSCCLNGTPSGQKALFCPIWHLLPLSPLTLLYISSYHLSLLDHILSMYWFTYLSSVSFSRI